MSAKPPEPPPYGALIEEAREQAGISAREAARRAGISDAWWRYIVRGYQKAPGDLNARADTIARMARVAGVTPEQLESEGQRPDAAEILRSEPEAPRLSPVPDPAPPLDLTVASDALINAFIEAQREDTEEEREFKEILRGTWRLHTVAHADKAAVLNALDALLHTGVPRRILAEREAQRRARETS